MRFAMMGAALLALAFAATLGAAADDKDEAPKHKIKDVMKVCMKEGLCKKVASGEASDEEKEKLVEMFAALAKNKAPKGDAKSWEEKTAALLKAAKECAEGKDGAGKALQAAANCAACHKAHKPA